MGSESSYLTIFAKFPAVSGAEYPSIMTYISKQSAPVIILQMSRQIVAATTIALIIN